MSRFFFQPRRPSHFLSLSAGLIFVLAGCSSISVSDTTAQATRKLNPAYVETVKLGKSDTRTSIAARYGGKVLVWESGVYALLCIDTPGQC